MNPLPRPLRGILPPVVTPLLDQDTLDAAALERILEKIIAAGVNGIFLLGTTGESASLSVRMRQEVIERACRAVSGRVPVLVNVSDTCGSTTRELAASAQEAGASAAVLSPPYYFPLSQEELLGYLRRMIPELGLPVFLYNFPALTKISYSPQMVRTVASEFHQVHGIKDSSGDLQYFSELCTVMKDFPEFAIFCGPEELLKEAMDLGAHGGITGGANLWPELYVDFYRAIAAGNGKETEHLRHLVLKLSKSVYRVREEGSSYLRGLKCALALTGECKNVLAEPLEPYGEAETLMIREALQTVGLVEKERVG